MRRGVDAVGTAGDVAQPASPSLAASSAATAAERSAGRTATDWDGLASWYTGGAGGRSGPAQLRAAAEQALGQLIANAKRVLAATGTGVSRRSDLLRLASWFSEAHTDEAHGIFAAAFGTYPSRHLLVGPDEQDGRATAATSWWTSQSCTAGAPRRSAGTGGPTTTPSRRRWPRSSPRPMLGRP